jgi:peptide/nickel transport system substrate-binding protein
MATKKRKMSWKAASFLMVFVLSAGSFALAAEPKGEVVFCSLVGSWATRVAYDPHTALGGSSATLMSLGFDGLITKDDKGAFQPALAESWKIADDWSAADFRLRRGVTFHNGDSFTAKDVKFSLERAMREDLQFVFGPEFRRNIKSVEIVDDYHVRIHLKEAFPGIMDRFVLTAIVPKGYVEKVGDAGFAAKPVGAGPFRVVNFSRDNFFKLEAVENHYRKTPFVKKFTLRNVAEPATRLAMLKTGEADLIALHATNIPVVEKDPNLKIFWSKNTYVMTLVFFDLAHPEDSPFKDPRVRRATSLAIDRKGITKALGHGSWEPWGSYLAPYHPGYDASRNIPDPYDPEKSRQLLAQAGYAKGFDTVLVAHSNYRAAFEAIQQQLKDVGIRARLEVPEHGSHASTFVAGKFRGIGAGTGPYWIGITHPGVAGESHITGTWSHKLTTPAVKKAMASLMMAIGDKAIAERARELDKILIQEMVRVPLWTIHQALGATPKIKDVYLVPGVQHNQGFEFLTIKDK